MVRVWIGVLQSNCTEFMDVLSATLCHIDARLFHVHIYFWHISSTVEIRHCLLTHLKVRMIFVWEVLVSNPGWGTKYLDWRSLWFSPVLSGKCRESTST